MGTHRATQKTIAYQQYFDECFRFGKALVAAGLYLSAVNIIGFNAPEWNVTFFGSLFARCLPVGIYTTNSESSCAYIAEHSECKLVVAETLELARKYLGLLESRRLEYIVLYKEDKPLASNHGGRLLKWADFLKLGEGYSDHNAASPTRSCRSAWTKYSQGTAQLLFTPAEQPECQRELCYLTITTLG